MNKKGGGEVAGTLSKPAGGRKAKTPRLEPVDKNTLDAEMDVRAVPCSFRSQQLTPSSVSPSGLVR